MIIGSSNFSIGSRTYIVGILNVTPDSFSDGGEYFSTEKAVARAVQMQQQGADIIDIGGESTRPNYTQITSKQEIERVVPVIKAVCAAVSVPVSIDTYKSQVAEAALDCGATMVNDIWGLKYDSNMAAVVAKSGAACCITHNRTDTDYKDFLNDVYSDLNSSIQIALDNGISKDKIVVDLGIGFAKSYTQNLTILKNLEIFQTLGYPLYLGVSRKSVIGNALNLDKENRLEGTLALTALGISKGVDFVRVHDVLENKRVALMVDTVQRSI